jgi:hypothetical protein
VQHRAPRHTELIALLDHYFLRLSVVGLSTRRTETERAEQRQSIARE